MLTDSLDFVDAVDFIDPIGCVDSLDWQSSKDKFDSLDVDMIVDLLDSFGPWNIRNRKKQVRTPAEDPDVLFNYIQLIAHRDNHSSHSHTIFSDIFGNDRNR